MVPGALTGASAFEAAVVDALATNDAARAAPLELLLGHLLSELLSWPPRALDGLVILRDDCTATRYFGVGFVVLIQDQSVQPVRMSFSLHPPTHQFRSGWIEIVHGEPSPIAYDSPEYARLSTRLLAFPRGAKAGIAWQHRFRRGARGWALADGLDPLGGVSEGWH